MPSISVGACLKHPILGLQPVCHPVEEICPSTTTAIIHDVIHSNVTIQEYLYGLQTHEWQTHGTCYSFLLVETATDTEALDAQIARYFQQQMDLFQNYSTPAIIPQVKTLVIIVIQIVVLSMHFKCLISSSSQ